MRPALTLLAALALAAAPLSPAGATTAPPLTLTQQAKKADVIVRATLGTAASVQEGGLTWTVYPLTVTETIAGDPATLPQREGRPALYLLTGVEGLPELRAGQEAFWLLYSRRLDSPVVGFTQGFYPIENGRVTRPGAAAPAASASPALVGPATAAGTGTAATGTTATGTGSTTGATGTAGAGTTGTPGTAAPGAPAAGTAPGAAGAATGTPASPVAPTGGTAGTITPPSATPPATTAPVPSAATATPTPADPDAIETDPVKFRDALRAARGTP